MTTEEIEGTAEALRELAEATANNSKNWDNYEKICVHILQQVIVDLTARINDARADL